MGRELTVVSDGLLEFVVLLLAGDAGEVHSMVPAVLASSEPISL